MPIVQEVGPFSFVEKSSKYDIRFSEGGTQVSYVTLSQLHYTGDPADLQQVHKIAFLVFSVRR